MWAPDMTAVAVVLVRIEVDDIDIEAEVERLLAPFDRVLDVEEYEVICDCVNNVEHYARPRAWRESLLGVAQEKVAPFREAARRAYEEYRADQQIPRDCGECQGTGITVTTENPQGKWDAWLIGGGFTGVWDNEYDPEKDPANSEECPSCNGTGV